MSQFTCTNFEKNKVACPCTNTTCKNYGICCDCVASHKEKKNYPACLRYEDK